MYMKPLESDWKVYRKSVHLWRDRYLETKNEEIAAVLLDGTRSSTERFWEAKEKLERQARVLVECLDDHSRSKMLVAPRAHAPPPDDRGVRSGRLQPGAARCCPAGDMRMNREPCEPG